MAGAESEGKSVHPLSDFVTRLFVPENVYAAGFLLDSISPASVRVHLRPLLEKAHWEVRKGNVSAKTLDRLVRLQTAF